MTDPTQDTMQAHTAEDAPAPPETPPDEAAPASTDEHGYEISICVYNDGTFAVKKEPLESPEQEIAKPQTDEMGQETGDTHTPEEAPKEKLASFEDALRTALKIWKQNPVTNNEEAQFKSGFTPRQAY